MSDTPAITQLIATVQYSAKVPTEVRYANREAGLFLQVDITGLSDADANQAIVNAYAQVKRLVENAIEQPEAAAVAIVKQEFPGAQVEAKREYTPRSSGSSGPANKLNAPIVQRDGEDWFDFTGLKASGAAKPKHPDYKRVSDNKSVWLQAASS